MVTAWCRIASISHLLMLGVLCARPKPWIFSSAFFLHGSAAHHHCRLATLPSQLASFSDHAPRRRHHSSACRLGGGCSPAGGAASIWHAILPSGRDGGFLPQRRWIDLPRPAFRGEGSWNVAWDARPARWLHRPDSAWLLFGVCACLAPFNWNDVVETEAVIVEEKLDVCKSSDAEQSRGDYRVTGQWTRTAHCVGELLIKSSPVALKFVYRRVSTISRVLGRVTLADIIFFLLHIAQVFMRFNFSLSEYACKREGNDCSVSLLYRYCNFHHFSVRLVLHCWFY